MERNKKRTHVDFFGKQVINDFDQLNDMRMVTLFHDRNLLANFVFCAAEVVCDGCMR